MSTFQEFLYQKRAALLARREEQERNPPEGPNVLKAHVEAAGRSGVRRIQIRQFEILSDSGPELAGYSFGPGSPEIQLGVLGSCLTHIFEIQAALLEVPLDSLEVDITGEIDFRAGKPGFEEIPVYPHNIRYDVKLRPRHRMKRSPSCTPLLSAPARFSICCSIRRRSTAR